MATNQITEGSLLAEPVKTLNQADDAPRFLIICLDGTNNYPNGGYTNIQRLCRILVRSAQQQTYYQPGAGTIEPNSIATRIGRKLVMLADAASDVMLERHVCSAYRYLMAVSRPGDVLCFFGFSRGAYAARALAGMLSKVGLLHAGFDEMVRFAWETYVKPKNVDAAQNFKANYSRSSPKLHLLGLFDTVSSVGLPWVPKSLPRTFDNPAVHYVRHAQSLDEHRSMFVQNAWTNTPATLPDGTTTDVRQVWFPGVHSDIGGGYPAAECGQSLVPLAWMVEHAMELGLQFDDALCNTLFGRPFSGPPHSFIEVVSTDQSEAPLHDELHSTLAWNILEYVPLPRRRHDAVTSTWSTSWVINRGNARHIPSNPLVHESARIRLGYKPTSTLVNPTYVSY